MHNIVTRAILLGTTLAALILSGCGASSKGTETTTVSGIAATGLPIAGQVYLKDSAAIPRELSAPTSADGSYVINVAGLTAPFIIKVLWTDSTGPQALVSFAMAPGTANINPLSHLIVANAAGATDADSIYNSSLEMKMHIGQNLKSSMAQVNAQLKPLLDSFGVTVDPMTGPFVANHTGLDALLDAVKIEAAGGSVMVTNRQSGATIFSAPIGSMSNGMFTASNLPVVQPAQAQPSLNGADLYATYCSSCHDALASSSKSGASVARIQSAINAKIGGMGSLSTLTAAQVQAIAMALGQPVSSPTTGTTNPAPAPTPAPAPSTTVDGAALYANNCAACHGALATSSKKGITLARLETAINGRIGGMGGLSALSAAEKQAIVDTLAIATSSPAPAPTPAPVPTPIPTPVPTTIDGAALYASNCAGCHGTLVNSGKKGITINRLQSAISNSTAGMGSLSFLSSAELQAIVDVLTAVAPVPTPTPTPIDGGALYASNCAGCHNPLAASGKAGATASRIQTAINNNTGGMGFLSSLNATQVQAIADVLAVTAPTPAPAPTAVCGSCHGLPPATGHHSKHRSRSCATCHGTGYSSTTVNAVTHNNGIKNIVSTIGWNATSRTCTNSCHGKETW